MHTVKLLREGLCRSAKWCNIIKIIIIENPNSCCKLLGSMALPLPDNPNIRQPDPGELTLVPKDKFRIHIHCWMPAKNVLA